MKRQQNQSRPPYFRDAGGQTRMKKSGICSHPAAICHLVSHNYVIPAVDCGKEAQKQGAPHIKTSKDFFSRFPNFDSQPLLVFTTSSSALMARLPRNDAPIEGGASLEDNSCKCDTRNITARLTFLSSHRRHFLQPPPFSCSSSGNSPRFAEDLQP